MQLRFYTSLSLAISLLFLTSPCFLLYAESAFKSPYASDAAGTIGIIRRTCAGYIVTTDGFNNGQASFKKDDVFYAYKESMSSVILIYYPHNIRVSIGDVVLMPVPKEWDNKLNINTASYEKLRKLSRVTDDIAIAIVSSRPFKTWEEIDALPGVGEKTLAYLQSILFIGPRYDAQIHSKQ